MSTAARRTLLPLRAAVAGVLLALLVVLPGAARSESDALLLATTDTAFQYERALHAEHLDAIRVNGLGFQVATGATTDALGVVLDHFEAVCADENVDLRSGVALLGRTTRSRVPFDGTLRTERDGRGAVACLGRNPGAEPRALLVRLQRFLAKSDVAAVGPLRLFFASSTAGRTTYVALSSEGSSLPVASAFPRAGDAPGRDPEGLPRPAAVVRRLSAWAPGSSASVAVYEAASVEPPAALAAYRSSLAAAGFEVSARPPSGTHFIARHGTRAVLASVTRSRDDGALLTVVSL